ncbi:MAG: type II toxin-antitoxin system RelB/DinJ family antitoxin [Catonella sp.]|uniref:type II toxin-antitoxin system RelB/DinJ family antitoxin n=1 Tax=Catonella sp. TaxID=2382125 RepID=UPI003F9FC3AE
MAQVVNVNFKLDADIKKSMEEACSEMGISMSAAFKIFAKKVGREKRIPFEITADPFYSESNIRYLEEKMEEYKAGKLKFAEHELLED